MLQWNLAILDTFGTGLCVLIREVVLHFVCVSLKWDSWWCPHCTGSEFWCPYFFKRCYYDLCECVLVGVRTSH